MRLVDTSAFRTPHSALANNLVLAALALAVGIAGGLAIALGNPFVPFVAVAALVAMPWAVTRPLFDLVLVVLTVTLLPYAVIPVRLAVLTPTLLEVGLLLLYGAWVLRLLFDPGHRLARTPIDGWLFLFLGFTVLAFGLGFWRDPSSDVLHNYFKLLLSAGIFFAACNVMQSTRQLAVALRALVISGAIDAALGLVLWRLPDATSEGLLTRLAPVGYPTTRVIRYIEDNPALGERAVGTQVDPNSFAGLLVIVAVFTGVCLLARKPILPRWLLAPMLLVDLGALVLSQSRTAFLGVVVAGVIVGALRYRKLLGWMIVGGVALLASGLASTYTDRLVAGLLFQDVSNQQRLAEYANALDVIRRYPVLGVGFGASGELDLTTGASSVYLTVAERAGLLGLAAYLVVIVVFLAAALPAVTASLRHAPRAGLVDSGQWSTLDAALLGGAVSVLAALIVGLADHYYFNIEFPHMVALFWLSAAITLTARRMLVEQRAGEVIARSPRAAEAELAPVRT